MKLNLLIKLNHKVANKDELFKTIASKLCKKGFLLSESEFINALNEREKEISTGVGKGVAFPHARLTNVASFVYVVRLKKAIDYNALDQMPCSLFFFLGAICEDKVYPHLKLLAASAKLLGENNNKDLFLKTCSKRKIKKILKQYYLPKIYLNLDENKLNYIRKKYKNKIILTNDKDDNLALDYSQLNYDEVIEKLTNLEGIV